MADVRLPEPRATFLWPPGQAHTSAPPTQPRDHSVCWGPGLLRKRSRSNTWTFRRESVVYHHFYSNLLQGGTLNFRGQNIQHIALFYLNIDYYFLLKSLPYAEV